MLCSCHSKPLRSLSNFSYCYYLQFSSSFLPWEIHFRVQFRLLTLLERLLSPKSSIIVNIGDSSLPLQKRTFFLQIHCLISLLLFFQSFSITEFTALSNSLLNLPLSVFLYFFIPFPHLVQSSGDYNHQGPGTEQIFLILQVKRLVRTMDRDIRIWPGSLLCPLHSICTLVMPLQCFLG